MGLVMLSKFWKSAIFWNISVSFAVAWDCHDFFTDFYRNFELENSLTKKSFMMSRFCRIFQYYNSTWHVYISRVKTTKPSYLHFFVKPSQVSLKFLKKIIRFWSCFFCISKIGSLNTNLLYSKFYKKYLTMIF